MNIDPCDGNAESNIHSSQNALHGFANETAAAATSKEAVYPSVMQNASPNESPVPSRMEASMNQSFVDTPEAVERCDTPEDVVMHAQSTTPPKPAITLSSIHDGFEADNADNAVQNVDTRTSSASMSPHGDSSRITPSFEHAERTQEGDSSAAELERSKTVLDWSAQDGSAAEAANTTCDAQASPSNRSTTPSNRSPAPSTVATGEQPELASTISTVPSGTSRNVGDHLGTPDVLGHSGMEQQNGKQSTNAVVCRTTSGETGTDLSSDHLHTGTGWERHVTGDNDTESISPVPHIPRSTSDRDPEETRDVRLVNESMQEKTTSPMPEPGLDPHSQAVVPETQLQSLASSLDAQPKPVVPQSASVASPESSPSVDPQDDLRPANSGPTCPPVSSPEASFLVPPASGSEVEASIDAASEQHGSEYPSSPPFSEAPIPSARDNDQDLSSSLANTELVSAAQTSGQHHSPDVSNSDSPSVLARSRRYTRLQGRQDENLSFPMPSDDKATEQEDAILDDSPTRTHSFQASPAKGSSGQATTQAPTSLSRAKSSGPRGRVGARKASLRRAQQQAKQQGPARPCRDIASFTTQLRLSYEKFGLDGNGVTVSRKPDYFNPLALTYSSHTSTRAILTPEVVNSLLETRDAIFGNWPTLSDAEAEQTEVEILRQVFDLTASTQQRDQKMDIEDVVREYSVGGRASQAAMYLKHVWKYSVLLIAEHVSEQKVSTALVQEGLFWTDCWQFLAAVASFKRFKGKNENYCNEMLRRVSCLHYILSQLHSDYDGLQGLVLLYLGEFSTCNILLRSQVNVDQSKI